MNIVLGAVSSPLKQPLEDNEKPIHLHWLNDVRDSSELGISLHENIFQGHVLILLDHLEKKTIDRKTQKESLPD